MKKKIVFKKILKFYKKLFIKLIFLKIVFNENRKLLSEPKESLGSLIKIWELGRPFERIAHFSLRQQSVQLCRDPADDCRPRCLSATGSVVTSTSETTLKPLLNYRMFCLLINAEYWPFGKCMTFFLIF